MEIDVNYISRKFYTKESISQWRWYYRPYTYIWGFQVRIFGVHFNVRESNSTEKLIAIGKTMRKIT